MLLVEQNARLALQAAHRAYVMESGLITLSGDAETLLNDPKVREAYLGEAPATDRAGRSLPAASSLRGDGARRPPMRRTTSPWSSIEHYATRSLGSQAYETQAVDRSNLATPPAVPRRAAAPRPSSRIEPTQGEAAGAPLGWSFPQGGETCALAARKPRRRTTKKLRPMTGNEAIARGAWEAGVKVAAAYPGTPSTEILESLATFPASDVHAQWSTNEKVALDVAIGASFAGARALAAMKHVGLNVAADSLMSQTYIGVNGGLVIVVADDPGIHSSQNEQDSRVYGQFAMVPVLEPSDAQEALEFTRFAFELSERFDTPVIVRTTTRLSHTRSTVELGARHEVPTRGFVDDRSKNVMIPAHARPRHAALLERELRLKEFLRDAPLNRTEVRDPTVGVITAGTCYPYVREVLPTASVLKLGASWPLSDDLLRAFCASVERVIVVEELEPLIERELNALGLAGRGQDGGGRRAVSAHRRVLARGGARRLREGGPADGVRSASRAVGSAAGGAAAGAVRRLSAHLDVHGGARHRCARGG